jgi:arabinose-5-phosphate isomerase
MTSCIEIAKNSLTEASQALSHLSSQLDSNFSDAIAMIMKSNGRLIVSGMGKSGHIGKKIAATLASTGTPSFFIHPAEAFHGDLGMIKPSDVILLISNSGETDEVIKLIPSLRRFGNKIISIANVPGSTLAKNSDVYLNIYVEKESCPNNLAPTTSTTTTLALGDALAVSLMSERNFQPEHFAEFHPGGSLGRRLLTRVRDEMLNKDLPFVDLQTPMNEVIITMTQSLQGIALVIDANQKLLGVITDGDLRRTLVRGGDLSQTLAREIMTKSPVTINEDSMLFAAETLMKENNITKLVVTSVSGKVSGILEL